MAKKKIKDLTLCEYDKIFKQCPHNLKKHCKGCPFQKLTYCFIEYVVANELETEIEVGE